MKLWSNKSLVLCIIDLYWYDKFISYLFPFDCWQGDRSLANGYASSSVTSLGRRKEPNKVKDSEGTDR